MKLDATLFCKFIPR